MCESKEPALTPSFFALSITILLTLNFQSPLNEDGGLYLVH